MLGNQTNAGKKALKKTSKAEQAVAKHFEMELLSFPESRTSRVDGVLVNNGVVVGVFETKSRNGDLKFDGQDPKFSFRGKDYDSMLVASSKIDTMAQISKLLQVASFLIITYDNGYIGITKVADQKGTLCIKGMSRKVTRTRANIVGGVADRENCFIPLDAATYIQEE